MATAQEIIRNFMAALDNTELSRIEALGEAARYSTGGGYASWESVVEAMYLDCRDYGSDIFLREGCGIILGNADTGAITGSDAGGGPEKTDESVVPENGNTWLLPESSSTTYGEYGLTVNWPNISNLSDSQKRIVSGLYTWWIPESLKLIRDSYGLTFNEGGTTVNTISGIDFFNEDSNTLAAVRYSARGGRATKLTLRINMKHYENVSLDVNGTTAGTFTLDRVIAHEMTHAVMAANINNFASLPSNIKEGAAELVHGIDDERKWEINYLSQNPEKLKEMLLDNYLTGTYEYAAGYMVLRYFAKQAAAGRFQGGKSGSGLPGGSKPGTPIDTTVRKLTVTTSGHYWLSGEDPLTGDSTTPYPDATEIDATASDGEIILGGNGKNNLLKAGSGGSSLWGGGASADTLQGGAGRDMIWFGAGDGNDAVRDFTDGNGGNADVLNLYSGTLTSVSRGGNNLTIKLSSGESLYVRTAAGADAVVLYSGDGVNISGAKIGEDSKSTVLTYSASVSFYQGGRSRDTLQAAGEENKVIWLDGSQGAGYSGLEVLDGSKSGGNDQLAGSAASETILAGRGRASLWGGAGGAADTLISGSGEDFLFYGYGEGNDLMTGTTANDRVMLYNMGLSQLTGAEIKADEISVSTTAGQTLTVKGSGSIFTLGDGSSWRADRQSKSWSAV